MEVRDSFLRRQLLTAALPFVVTASRIAGVKRIALIGSLTTVKEDPKDIDLLLTVENDADLAPLATAGRKLQGRVNTLTHGNFGADLFLNTPRHRYLSRLCRYKACPGFRTSYPATHCGARPYLRDDRQSVTLERALLMTPHWNSGHAWSLVSSSLPMWSRRCFLHWFTNSTSRRPDPTNPSSSLQGVFPVECLKSAKTGKEKHERKSCDDVGNFSNITAACREKEM